MSFPDTSSYKYGERKLTAIPTEKLKRDDLISANVLVVFKMLHGNEKLQTVYDWLMINASSIIQRIIDWKAKLTNWFNFVTIHSICIAKVGRHTKRYIYLSGILVILG